MKRITSLFFIIVVVVMLMPVRNPAQAVTNAFFIINRVEDTGGCNGTPAHPATPILNVSYGWEDAFRARQMTEIFAAGRLVYRWGAVLAPPSPSRTRYDVSGWLAGYVSESFPSGTLMTVTITLEFDGVLSASSSVDFLCDGNGIVRFTSGADQVIYPAWAVVGAVNETVTAYWEPQDDAVVPGVVIEVGKTLWVTGIDETGRFYQVVLSGRYFWLPAWAMGPNYDDVWRGTPLPTVIVG